MSRARAHANIALVKYWGKRDTSLNLPAAGSLSLTLGALTTETEVTFGHESDQLTLDGEPTDGKALARLTGWLDIIRSQASTIAKTHDQGIAGDIAGDIGGAHVVSANDFPTASGLASSASAYAALALAASDAAGLKLSTRELSVLARIGSGSAARSIHGGIALMHPGTKTDGSDAFAESLGTPEQLADWPLSMVVAVVGGGVAKKISSRDAMAHCAESSPLYNGWVDSVAGDIDAARNAIAARDLGALGSICEHSALAMHAAAFASRPPIIYFRPTTLRLIELVGELRDSGVPAFFTIDAGPHVKILTLAEHSEEISNAVLKQEGVTSTIISGVGGPAELIGAQGAR